MEQFRYSINGIQVNPHFNDDMSLVFEKESNYNFFRSKLSDNVTFVGRDYDLLVSQDIETEFVFRIDKYYYYDKAWEPYFIGKFYKTDGKWDRHDKRVTVSITPKDPYDDILAGLDKEFSLIKITEEKHEVVFDKKGVIQLYMAGSDYVSNIQNGVYSEQKTKTQLTDHNTIMGLGFMAEATFKEITVYGKNEYTSDYLGVYSSVGEIKHENALKTTYAKVTLHPNGDYGSSYPGDDKWHYKCIIYNKHDDSIVAVFKSYSETGRFESDPYRPQYNKNTYAYVNHSRTYSRILSNIDIKGMDTVPISDADIVETEYTKIIKPYSTLFNPIGNFEFTTEANQYGKYPESDLYYCKPESNFKVYQAFKSNWKGGSIWLISAFDESLTKSTHSTKDGYLLSTVINSLLREIKSDIVHHPNKDCSQFLYSEINPITNTKNYNLLITQITNVLSNYSAAATKTPIRLGQILKMLKVCYDCDWFVQNGKLRIEHSEFFKRGGTYDKTDDIIDLTKLICAKNSRSWDFGSSVVEYEKVQMPERYKFKWHDEVSSVFNGYDMETISKFVSRGKVEEYDAGNFISDIDFSVIAPNAISKDGYMLFGAEKKDNGYVLPCALINNGYEELKVQNGYLSFAYLQSKFLTFNMPSKNITVNGIPKIANGTMYGRTNSVRFPAVAELTTTSRIKTSTGIGIIDKFSVNLGSEIVIAILKYDTYE